MNTLTKEDKMRFSISLHKTIVIVELVSLQNVIELQETNDLLAKKGLRPATLLELLTFQDTHPQVIKKNKSIIATGTVLGTESVHRSNRIKYIGCLREDGLHLLSTDLGWVCPVLAAHI